jgi:hypothetical protein
MNSVFEYYELVKVSGFDTQGSGRKRGTIMADASMFNRESIPDQTKWIMSQLTEQEYNWLSCNVAEVTRREYNKNNFVIDEIPAYIEVLINKREDPKENDMRRVICKKLGLT